MILVGVLVAGGAIALFVRGTTRDSVTNPPLRPAAVQVATDFLAAYTAYDADRVAVLLVRRRRRLINVERTRLAAGAPLHESDGPQPHRRLLPGSRLVTLTDLGALPLRLQRTPFGPDGSGSLRPRRVRSHDPRRRDRPRHDEFPGHGREGVQGTDMGAVRVLGCNELPLRRRGDVHGRVPYLGRNHGGVDPALGGAHRGLRGRREPEGRRNPGIVAFTPAPRARKSAAERANNKRCRSLRARWLWRN